MREPIRDINRLQHILEAIMTIEDYISNKSFEEFTNDKLLKHAVYYNVGIVGEAASKLSSEFTDSHQDVPWRDIIKMRHVLIHGYYQLNSKTMWMTIKNDLPTLRSQVEKILAEMK